MEWPSLNFGDLGAGALVVLAVIALFRGWLVPRSHVDDLRADRDARFSELIKERDDWKTAYFDSEKSRGVLAEQVGEFTELARVWLQALQSDGKGGT